MHTGGEPSSPSASKSSANCGNKCSGARPSESPALTAALAPSGNRRPTSPAAPTTVHIHRHTVSSVKYVFY